MSHDKTKWAIKFSGGEGLQAQSAQRFAIFLIKKNNHFMAKQETGQMLSRENLYPDISFFI